MVPGEGPRRTSERWLRWDLGPMQPGRVVALRYEVEITDLPEPPVTGSSEALGQPVREVAQVDSLLRDSGYRDGLHPWENRAWFGALQRGTAVRSDAVGADLQLAFERTQKPIKITLDDVLFDTGKATLRPEAYGVLNPAADAIRSRPGWKVRIEGHCDIRPIHTHRVPDQSGALGGARPRDPRLPGERREARSGALQGARLRRAASDRGQRDRGGRQKNRRVDIIIYGEETTERSFKAVAPGTLPGTVRLDLR